MGLTEITRAESALRVARVLAAAAEREVVAAIAMRAKAQEEVERCEAEVRALGAAKAEAV